MDLEKIHTSAILKEIPTTGHSPLLVMGSDFEKYVVKNDKGKQPPYALINECLAACFLNLWNIKTPEAKLMEVDKDLVASEENLSINHKKFYYNTLCFGSKFIGNPIDVNNFLISTKKKTYNRLINPLDVMRITLFDTWVENDDRKPTNYNLILEPFNNKFRILPIDNAYIFSTMAYKDLMSQFVSVSANEHLLVSPLGYLVKKHTKIDSDFIKNEKEYFYLCIEKCQRAFEETINSITAAYNLDQDSVKALGQFLFNADRNTKVFEEYVYRLEQ